MPRDALDVASSSGKGGRRKARTPYLARSPDETISMAAFHKLKEELEDMKANAPPITDIDPLTMRPAARATRSHAEQEETIFEEYSREFIAQRQHKTSNKKRVPADVDLRKHQRNLFSSTRYDKLRFYVKQRCDPDWEADVADLQQKHGAWHRVKTAQDKRRRVKTAGDSPALGKAGHKQHSPLTRQLRELHKHFADPDKDKNALGIQVKGKLKARHMEDQEVSNSPRSRAVLTFLDFMLTRFGGLRESFQAIDHNRNGRVTRVEFNQVLKSLKFHPQVGDADEVFRLLDLNHDGEISIREFQSFKPYLDQLLSILEQRHCGGEEDTLTVSTSSPGRNRPDSTGASPSSRSREGADGSPSARGRLGSDHSGFSGQTDSVDRRRRGSSSVSQTPGQRADTTLAEKAPHLHKLYALRQKEKDRKSLSAAEEMKYLQNRLPEIEMPRTWSLTVFRNADKAHAGAPLFLRQTPASLENLYAYCDKVCRPVAGTVQVLLDQDMCPLRSVEDLRNGSAYLAKGPEALEPPMQFWQFKPPEHRATSSSAIRSRRGSAEEHAPEGAQELERRESDGAAELLRKVTEDAIEELNAIEEHEGNATRLPDTMLPFVAKPEENLAAKTCPAGWSLQGAISAPCRPRAMAFTALSPDPQARCRDREWHVYEAALGTFWPPRSAQGTSTPNRSDLNDWQFERERAIASRERVAALQRRKPDDLDGVRMAGSASRAQRPSLQPAQSSPDLFSMSIIKRDDDTPDKAWSTQSSWNSPLLHQSASLPKI